MRYFVPGIYVEKTVPLLLEMHMRLPWILIYQVGSATILK